jgi:single-stranded-DNA-specific exonuclease
MNLSNLPTLSKERVFKLLTSRLEGDSKTLKDLPDPNSFKDMQKATKRVLEAIYLGEKIAIVGDYDVDGVVATTIMRKFFEAIDYPIEWIIPNRFKDGYGVSKSVIERLNSPDLIITVDNGISANEAILECNKRGIDVIITDHHIVPKNPPQAYAIINQKQDNCNFPYDEICGAQVAWYFCASIRRALGADVDIKGLLELVALAIVADIMPLLHINRVMLKSGLKLLEQSDTPFVQAYREFKSMDSFRADDIAFGLAPILNSAGRIDDAKIACEYLFAKDLNRARELLKTLKNFNGKRKEIESQITKEAIESSDSSQEIIVSYGANWHEGVVGIVASRVSRYFEKPAIVLTKSDKNIFKGSGRSFGECNLFEAVNRQNTLLKGFGGHSKAIGLALEENNLDKFISSLQESAKKICPDEPYIDKAIFGILPFEEIDFELFELIDRFEPFGHANRRPKFISVDVEIVSSKALNDGEHYRYIFKKLDRFLEGVHFRSDRGFVVKDRVNILYSIDENIFNNSKKLQLLVEKIWIYK